MAAVSTSTILPNGCLPSIGSPPIGRRRRAHRLPHGRRADRLTNVRPPLDLDASALPWPVSAADAILAINMVHISPWAATQGLLREAARLLPPGGLLYLYGPFIEAGIPLAAQQCRIRCRPA